MGGFPTRITRTAIGPDLEDRYPVTDPNKEIGAKDFNLVFWQLCGLNLTSWQRAVVAASWNGSAFDYLYQEEAWNSKRTQSHPSLARSAAGVYTYTFASTYKDEEGADISTGLRIPRASLMAEVTAYANRREIFAWIPAGTPLVVQIRIFDSSGTGQDEPFVLEVG